MKLKDLSFNERMLICRRFPMETLRKLRKEFPHLIRPGSGGNKRGKGKRMKTK